MHVMRPKSAKGRTRPKVTQAHTVDDEHYHQKPTFCPHPPTHPHPPPPPPPPPRPSPTPSHRFDPSLHFRTSDTLTEAFEKAQDIPMLTLNRYKVLPSIEKRLEGEASTRGMEEKASRLNLHGHRFSRLCPTAASKSDPQMRRASEATRGPAEPARTISACQEGEAELLLALRTPCGQRFKCHFHPTDTLQAVVAAAEASSGSRYEHALIETMEVPRRSFTNLTMTLSQCGIFNKSVLCISLKDTAMDSC